MGLLKLAALDPGDLEIISAAMQDAVVRIGDICHVRSRKKLALLANRFAWDAVDEHPRGHYERRRSGLQFARVLKVSAHGIRQEALDGVLSLLSIGFEPKAEPEGTIVLSFSGGGTIRIDVECIEAQLEDLGPAWETRNLPSHET